MCRITSEYQGYDLKKNCLETTSDYLLKPLRCTIGNVVTVTSHNGTRTYTKEEGLCPLGRTIMAVFAIALLPLILLGIVIAPFAKSRRVTVQEHNNFIKEQTHPLPAS